MIAKTSLAALIILIFLFIPVQAQDNNSGGNEINRSNLDTTVSPAVDFYDYANGGWLKDNTIPAEYPAWGSVYQLLERNYDQLKGILTDAEKAENAPEGSVNQMVGNFYYSGMDTVKIEKDGYKPIEAELNKIDAIKSSDDLYNALVDIHLGYSNALFSFSAGPDSKNSKIEIAQLDQSGLGLPDRDYYLKEDKRSKQIREEYVKHVAKMFELIGNDSVSASEDANTVMKIETELAKASMSKVERRDPQKTYNKMPLDSLKKLSPDFNWNYYFTTIGTPDPGEINVSEPDFFKAVSSIVKDTPLKDMKTYLKWNIIRNSANYLSDPFVSEHFNFYGTILQGRKVMQTRWKRVLGTINGNIGMQVGKIYVKKYFPPEAKARAKKLVENLIDVLGKRIKNLEWMSDSTKEKALVKLEAITVKIGYPDKWKDYTGLKIERDSYFKNVVECSIFNTKKNLGKIGKTVDKTEWFMSPQTINAYYNPLNNEIVFPAAILQPPFFDQNADDAVNYGAIGSVIGHEMTHGFDDQGRQFDANGNLTDWWTKKDGENFDKRAEVIIKQFDNYTPIDTLHINGKLTVGENIADLGGISISFEAFRGTEEYKEGKKIDGFTPAQRFFLSFANAFRQKSREQYARMLLQVDPHSPNKFRVNGPMSNLPAFWNAFNVKPGDPMRRPEDKLVKIW